MYSKFSTFQKRLYSKDSLTFEKSNESGYFEFVAGKIIKETVEFISITTHDFQFLLVENMSIKEEKIIKALLTLAIIAIHQIKLHQMSEAI